MGRGGWGAKKQEAGEGGGTGRCRVWELAPLVTPPFSPLVHPPCDIKNKSVLHLKGSAPWDNRDTSTCRRRHRDMETRNERHILVSSGPSSHIGQNYLVYDGLTL